MIEKNVQRWILCVILIKTNLSDFVFAINKTFVWDWSFFYYTLRFHHHHLACEGHEASGRI
jgi:EamA domain-containing membrane protein RarD